MTNLSDKRRQERETFLSAAEWSGAETRALAGDASTRSYERLSLGPRKALLMNAPPAAEEPACPSQANPAERRALGYNALARLAGPNLHAFLAIAKTLRAAGTETRSSVSPKALTSTASQKSSMARGDWP